LSPAVFSHVFYGSCYPGYVQLRTENLYVLVHCLPICSEKSLSGHLTSNFHFSFPIYLATKGCLLQKCFYGRRMKNRVKENKVGDFCYAFSEEVI